LQSVQLGEPQNYKNIAIVPVIAPTDGTFQYRTLGEALPTSALAITESCAAGSVPELMVVKCGFLPHSNSPHSAKILAFLNCAGGLASRRNNDNTPVFACAAPVYPCNIRKSSPSCANGKTSKKHVL
jgi:hypothetical protein